MDILVSSNFERYLYDLAGKSSKKLILWMKNFENKGVLNIEKNLLKIAQKDFLSASADDLEVISIIQKYYKKFKYILDPHTAVGIYVAEKLKLERPSICLACAHPAKFDDTIQNIIEFRPNIPKELSDLNDLETKFETVLSDEKIIKQVILKHLNFESKQGKDKN